MTIPADVERRLLSIRNLPTLPTVIENLGGALRDPDVQASRIAEIIEDDPAIMARIMKIVNSSFYLGAEKAGSLKSAIVRLGFQAVSNIAMSAAVFSTFPPGPKTGFDRAAFWEHCICTGIAADVVCRRLTKRQEAMGPIPGFPDPPLCIPKDRLHLCGLLHDIGKIIFEQFFHDRFVSAVNISKEEHICLADAEKRLIGIDHAQAGAWLATRWNLSGQLVDVIRWHHEPEKAQAEYRPLVNICRLADFLVNAGRIGESGNAAHSDPGEISGRFDLSDEDLVYMTESIREASVHSRLLMFFLQ